MIRVHVLSKIAMKFRHTERAKRTITAVTVVVVVAILGAGLTFLSHAATPVASIEAEIGTLAGGAAIVSDPTASGGEAVRFGSVSTPPSTIDGCTVNGVAAPCMSGSNSGTGASGWGTPVFDDEFNGTSVNTGVWQTTCPDWDGTLNGGNVAGNVSESGGALELTESASGQGACVESSDYAGAAGYRFSGYGFAEARVSFPGSGSTIYDWPAWWLVGANDDTVAPNNATGDETDIAEGLGGKLTTTEHYWHTAGCSVSDNNNGCQQQLPVASGSYADSYHTFGVDREAGETTVYYDGTSIGTLPTKDGGKPVWLVFNIGDGEWGGSKVYGTNGTMKVDYVRVWQK